MRTCGWSLWFATSAAVACLSSVEAHNASANSTACMHSESSLRTCVLTYQAATCAANSSGTRPGPICDYDGSTSRVIAAVALGGCMHDLTRDECKADNMPCDWHSGLGCVSKECSGAPTSIVCKNDCPDPCYPKKKCTVDACICEAPEPSPSQSGSGNSVAGRDTVSAQNSSAKACPKLESFTFTGNLAQACGILQTSQSRPAALPCTCNSTANSSGRPPASATAKVTAGAGGDDIERDDHGIGVACSCDQPIVWIVLIIICSINFLLLLALIVHFRCWLVSGENNSNDDMNCGSRRKDWRRKTYEYEYQGASGQAKPRGREMQDELEALNVKFAEMAQKQELLLGQVVSMNRNLGVCFSKDKICGIGRVESLRALELCSLQGEGEQDRGVEAENWFPSRHYKSTAEKPESRDSSRCIPSIDQPELGSAPMMTPAAADLFANGEHAGPLAVNDLKSFWKAYSDGKDQHGRATGSDELELASQRHVGSCDLDAVFDRSREHSGVESQSKDKIHDQNWATLDSGTAQHVYWARRREAEAGLSGIELGPPSRSRMSAPALSKASGHKHTMSVR